MSTKATMFTSLMTLQYLISSINGGRNILRCSDAEECYDSLHAISSNYIECSGYESCGSGSTIYAKGAEYGIIECSASYACASTRNIKADGDLFCSGFYSCWNTKSIDANTIECSGAYSCNSVDLITSDTTVTCNGLQACEASTIKAEKSVECQGALSCNGATITSFDKQISCSGTRACFDAKLTTSDSIVKCEGNYACRNARIFAKKVLFSGSSAAENTRVSANKITAVGYNTLSYSEIDSEGRSSIKVTASKESAGVDATVICRAGSECNVVCTDGCENLEILEMNGANISVTVDTGFGVDERYTCGEEHGSMNLNATSTSHNDIGCPIIQSSSSDCGDEQLLKYLEMKREVIKQKLLYRDLKYETDTKSGIIADDDRKSGLVLMDDHYKYEPDDIDNVKADGFVFECRIEKECANTRMRDDSISCLGWESCLQSVMNQTSDNDGNSQILAYGEQSAMFSSLETNNILKCNGQRSCTSAHSFIAPYVDCGGKESCAYISATMHVQNIYCIASLSCAENYILSVGSVRCFADQSCKGSHIRSVKLEDGMLSGASIQCEGYRACSGGKLYARDGFIECTAKQSCFESIIETPRYVYIDAEESAKQSIIFAPNVRIYGYYGATKSAITSYNNTLSLKVRLEGDLAGYDAFILCRSNSNCSVICETSGCKSLQYICFKGANCEISPTGCNRPIKKPKAVDGINCPNITQSNEIIETDADVLEFIRKNKNLKSFQALSSMNKRLNDDGFIEILSNEVILNENNGDNNKEIKNGNYMKLMLVGSGIMIILFFISSYAKNKNEESKHYEMLI